MKIKVAHHDSPRFDALRRAIADQFPAAEISGIPFAGGDLPPIVNGTIPDLLIVDGATNRCLSAIESLNLHSPTIDTLLITQDTSTEFLMGAMRAGVREMIPAAGGNEALQAALTRVLRKRSQKTGAERQEGKVLTFLSCKGGSGATFIAGNLAYVLATEKGKRVALIDMNLLFGDAALSVSDQRPPSDVAELSQQIHRLDASLLEASMLEAAPNFFVLAAPEDPVRSTDVKREHAEAIVRLARQHYDFVVIDVPRQLDPVTLLALDLADMIFPVVQLSAAIHAGWKRLLSLFRTLDYPSSKVRMIVNRYEKGGELSLDDLARATGTQAYRTVPNFYPAATSSVNLGVPVVKMQKNNPISKVLIEMAQNLAPSELPAHHSNWLLRVFLSFSAT